MNKQRTQTILALSFFLFLFLVLSLILESFHLYQIQYFVNLKIILVLSMAGFGVAIFHLFPSSSSVRALLSFSLISIFCLFLLNAQIPLSFVKNYDALLYLFATSLVLLTFLSYKSYLFDFHEKPTSTKFSLGFLLGIAGLFLLFLIVQIYRLYTTGIGTDEGNFLYAIKQLSYGEVLFKDFWIRESLVLLFLLPFQGIFGNSIENLRFFVLGVHILIFVMFILLMRQYSTDKKQIFFVLVLTTVVLHFNGAFEFYSGVFYQLSYLFNLFIIFLLTHYYFKESKGYSLAAFLGALVAMSTLTYKGGEILLVIIPVMIILKKAWEVRENIARILLFFLFYYLIVFMYWAYYAMKTDFTHIFNLILIDVVLNALILLIVFLIGLGILALLIRSRLLASKFKISEDLILLLLNIILLVSFVLRFFEDPERLYWSVYGGLIFNYLFLLMFIQFANIYLSSNRIFLALIYLPVNIALLVMGYGERGFYTEVLPYYHMIAAYIFIAYNILLLAFAFKQNSLEYKKETKLYFLLILTFFWFIISILGGPLMPTRFQTISIFLPILLLSFSLIKTPMKTPLYIFILVALTFTVYTNATLPNDYTFYGYDNFKEARDYINTNLDEYATVFSLDTPLLTETKFKSIISFYSNSNFYKEEPSYLYPGMREKYAGKDIALNQSEIFAKIVKERPEYIFGTSRNTFKFFTQNEEFAEYLSQNYVETKQIGRITIMRRRSWNV